MKNYIDRFEFRVWNIDKKKMFKVEDITFDYEGKVCYVGYNSEQFMISELILEQYTGLSDIKGVKIFDGDILAGMQNIDKTKIDKSTFFAVKFENGCWNIGSESSTEYRIVGNIHKNTELLEN